MAEEPGGITGVVDTLLEAGLQQRVSITYVGLCPFGGSFSRWVKLWHYFRNGWPLAFGILSRRATVMHFHVSHGVSLWRKTPFVLLSRLMGLPTILHIHSGRFFEPKGMLWKPWLVGRIMNTADRVVVLSDVWRRPAAAWAPKAKVDVINNPTHIDYQDPHPTRPPASPPMVLYLGRIIPSKGIYDLLDAIPLIVSAYGDVRFRVAGNGETEAFLDACRRKGLDRYVDFLGWADEQTKRDAFASATLFVHPTHYEGFGRAVVEAMAASLPIVATKVGAIIDILHDGENGLLVEPGDPAALATAVVTLLSDAGRRRSMAQANRAKAFERYSSSTIVDHWSRLYQTLGAGDRT